MDSAELMRYYIDTRTNGTLQAPKLDGFDITHLKKVTRTIYRRQVRDNAITEKPELARKAYHTRSKTVEDILASWYNRKQQQIRYRRANRELINMRARERRARNKGLL